MLVPSDRRATRRTFPGWTPFAAFAVEHLSLGRDTFLERVRTAHLLLWTPLADEAADATFTTIMARPGRRPPLALASAACAVTPDAVREATPCGVAPVEKRPGANPFALMVTLGRAPNNDVVLNHPALSKFHAYLRRGAAGGWVIDDAGSTNGTLLDGQPVEKARGLRVRSGARITLGGEVEVELVEPEDLWTRLRGA